MYRAKIKNDPFIAEHKIKIVTKQEEEKIDFRKILNLWIKKNQKFLEIKEIIDVQQIM